MYTHTLSLTHTHTHIAQLYTHWMWEFIMDLLDLLKRPTKETY